VHWITNFPNPQTGQDYDFNNPANWDLGYVPGPEDDATIITGVPITVVGQNDTVHSLTCNDGLAWTGTLGLLNNSSIHGNFTLTNGLLNVGVGDDGQGAQVTLSAGGSVSNSTVTVGGAASLVAMIQGQFFFNNVTATGPGFVSVATYFPTLTIDGSCKIDNLELGQNGTIQANVSFGIAKDFRWKGGTLAGDSMVAVSPGATMELMTQDTKNLQTTELLLSTNVVTTWTGGDVVVQSGSTITQSGDATFYVDCNQTMQGGGKFDNNGSFVKRQYPEGKTIIQCTFNNWFGSDQVGVGAMAGTIDFQGDGEHSGKFIVWDNATIEFGQAEGAVHTQTCDDGTQFLIAPPDSNGGNSQGNGIILLDDNAKLNFPGGVVVPNYATFKMTTEGVPGAMPPVIDGGGNFNNFGTFEFTAGTLREVIFDNRNWLIVDGTDLTLDRSLIRNWENVKWSGNNLGNSTITFDGNSSILNYGTFDDACDGRMWGFANPLASFENSQFDAGTAGYFIKTWSLPTGGGFTDIEINFRNDGGTVDINGFTIKFESNLDQTSGTFLLHGGTVDNVVVTTDGDSIIQQMDVLGGTISGPGTITGDLYNNGSMDLGPKTGTLSIGRNFTEGSNGAIRMKIGGIGVGETDFISVGGDAFVDGFLYVAWIDLGNGYQPGIGDSFTLISAGNTLRGVFSDVSLPDLTAPRRWAPVDYTNNAVILNIVEGE
jgi:hypothetical protein